MSAVVNTYRKIIKSGKDFVEVIHNLWEGSKVSIDDVHAIGTTTVQELYEYIATGTAPGGSGSSEIDFGNRMTGNSTFDLGSRL